MKKDQYLREANRLINEHLMDKCDFVILRHYAHFKGTSLLEFKFTERTKNRIKLLTGNIIPIYYAVNSEYMTKVWIKMPPGCVKVDITVLDIPQMLFMLNIMREFHILIFDYMDDAHSQISYPELFKILDIPKSDEISTSIINEYRSLHKNLQMVYVDSSHQDKLCS